jgi:hypothetical protein
MPVLYSYPHWTFIVLTMTVDLHRYITNKSLKNVEVTERILGSIDFISYCPQLSILLTSGLDGRKWSAYLENIFNMRLGTRVMTSHVCW